MATTIKGQTIWSFQEPSLEDVLSGDYALPVNFKIVDENTSTYKIVSFVSDSVNGARRIELGGNETQSMTTGAKIPIWKDGDVLGLNDVTFFESGIWQSNIENNALPPIAKSSFSLFENYKYRTIIATGQETAGHTNYYALTEEAYAGENIFVVPYDEGINIGILIENVPEDMPVGYLIGYQGTNIAGIQVKSYQDMGECEDGLLVYDAANIIYNTIFCPFTENFTDTINDGWMLLAEINKNENLISTSGTSPGKPITGGMHTKIDTIGQYRYEEENNVNIYAIDVDKKIIKKATNSITTRQRLTEGNFNFVSRDEKGEIELDVLRTMVDNADGRLGYFNTSTNSLIADGLTGKTYNNILGLHGNGKYRFRNYGTSVDDFFGDYKGVVIGSYNSTDDENTILKIEDKVVKIGSLSPNFKGIEFNDNISGIDPDNKNIVAQRSYVEAVKSFTRSQWSRQLTAPITVPNNGILRLLNGSTTLRQQDVVANGTSAHDPLSIRASGGIVVPWAGVILHHTIRVSFEIVSGTDQNYHLRLIRLADNSVIGANFTINRNSDYSGVMVNFETYTNSETDPFVTGGFDVEILNTSGNTMQIATTTPIGVYVKTGYETPRKF